MEHKHASVLRRGPLELRFQPSMNQRRQPDPQDKALFDTVIRLTLVILVLGQAAAGRTETDIWGHMSIGLDMLASRSFLWVDPYSFTHDQVWVNHEWLWDLTTAAIFKAGGLPGLLLFRAALAAAVLAVVERTTRGVPPAVRTAAIVMVGLACIGQWRSTRPQTATLAIYALVIADPTALWVPFVFLLWANVHGGWLFGLAAVWCRATFVRTPRAVGVAAASTLATLVNPYGVGLWTAIVEAMSRGWSDLTEWQPVWRLAAGGDALVLWLLVAGASGMLWIRVRHEASRWIWVALALAAAAGSRRLTALAGLTTVVTLLPMWNPRAEPVAVTWKPARRAFAALAIAASFAIALSWVVPTASCFPPLPGWRTPEPDAVAFLRRARVTRVVPHFDYGEYAIYHLRDRLQVAIDNRRETVYSERSVEENQRFMEGVDFAYPDRIGADAVWWPAASRTVIDGLEQRGWFRRFEGPRTVVLTRVPGPLVRGVDMPGTPCFPNP